MIINHNDIFNIYDFTILYDTINIHNYNSKFNFNSFNFIFNNFILIKYNYLKELGCLLIVN